MFVNCSDLVTVEVARFAQPRVHSDCKNWLQQHASELFGTQSDLFCNSSSCSISEKTVVLELFFP